MTLKRVYGLYTILGLYSIRIWHMASILWFICSSRNGIFVVRGWGAFNVRGKGLTIHNRYVAPILWFIWSSPGARGRQPGGAQFMA